MNDSYFRPESLIDPGIGLYKLMYFTEICNIKVMFMEHERS